MDRPLCIKCNKNLACPQNSGRGYKPKCDGCSRNPATTSARYKRAEHKKFPWKAHRKDYCEVPNCTTTIVHPCQLDVDHIDGNNKNNDPSNLMTMCASCHRLKTFLNRDWDKKAVKTAVAVATMLQPQVTTN